MASNNLTEGGAAAFPLRMNRKEICYALYKKKMGAFVTPQGRARYDKLNLIFVETGLFEKVNLVGGTFSVADTKLIIQTLNL
jgi:hypothetical protein